MSLVQYRAVVKDGIGGPVAICDFNGDSRLDVAVTTSSGFDVLLQQAGGSLAAPPPYTDNRAQVRPLVVMDVDRDGILDRVGIGSSQVSAGNSSVANGYGIAPGSENTLVGSLADHAKGAF